MRKAIRCTVYAAPGVLHNDDVPGPKPMTVVTFAENLIVEPEALAEQMRMPGAFVAVEVFETPANTELDATEEAVERIDAETEDNQAIMYWWIIGAMHNVSREGAIMLTGPNPLTEEQSVEVLEQIVLHPLYAEQRISTPDRTDERWVILNEGKITTEDR